MNPIILEDLIFITKSFNYNQIKDKTFLITGGYGMFLSYFVYELLYLNQMYNLNIKILLLVNNLYKAEVRFQNFKDKNLQFISGDLLKPIDIDDQIDYIIHGASKTQWKEKKIGDEVFANPVVFKDYPVDVLSLNIIGTYNLLEFAKSKKIKSFIFISSATVYGEPRQEVVDEEYIGDTDFNSTKNCYTVAKQTGEHLCQCYHKQYNVPIIMVRPVHNYGPSMDIENDVRAISRFAKNILNNEPLIIYGKGNAKRSFTYIADSTTAMFLIITKGKDTLYNISDNKEYISINNLIKKITKTLNLKNLKIIMKDKDEKHNNFLAYPKNLLKLDWECKYTLEEGLKRTFAYYKGLR